MATLILNAIDLTASNVVESIAIASVGNIIVDVEFASLAGFEAEIICKLKASDGGTEYKPLKNPQLKDIRFKAGEKGVRIAVEGINAENVKLFIYVPSSITAGTVSAWYTKTDNANS